MKFNPFRPNGLTAPGMFYGRVAEIEAIERSLFQAKYGNPVHFLVQGERGIGKSSLFNLVQLTASGRIAPLNETPNLRFLVVSVDLGGAHTQVDIIRSIARELRGAVAERETLKAKAKVFWEWASNWEVLGVRFHKDSSQLDPQEVSEDLVTNVAGLCASLAGEIDGILFLVDEADRPEVDAGLGEFCKYFTERLARKSCSNVVLGLAGLPSLLSKLRASHESSPRVFTTMTLDPLSASESKSVVKAGIKSANQANKGNTTEITNEALELLATLSEGYPHFIQQFSYSAFDVDSDDVIDAQDVIKGAFAENGALSQLGDKYFSEMYHTKIASNDYREVLHTMARHADGWVSRKVIIQESRLASATVTNALNALKARNIIVADDSRKGRGFYRLPTRSFAAWINAIQSISEKTGTPPPAVAAGPFGD